MTRRFPRLAAAALALALAAAGIRAEAVFRLRAAGSEPATGLGTFPDTAFEGVRYVSSRLLESLFRREGAWVPERQKFVLDDSSGRKWYFTLDNPYINIGDEVFNLIYPVRRGPEYLYLPLPPLLRILDQKGWRLEVSDAVGGAAGNAAAGLRTPDGQVGNASSPPAAGSPNLLGLSAEDREGGTLVNVRVSGPLEWESFWAPPHFILRFQGGKAGPDYPIKADGAGLVKSILTVQEKEVAQVTLHIPGAIDTVEVAYAPDTRVYQVTVRKRTARTARTAPPEPAAARILDPGKTTIIIDPGHGGKDQGAMVAGVNEAQITLAVAKELKAALSKLGYRALMTRESDTFISLPDRPKFASGKGGDIFISLHCNAIGGSPKRKREVSGFTAYILRAGESEEDKALARRENEAIGAEGGKSKSEISPVEWILLEHQLNLYSKESESFAAQIVSAFDGNAIAKYQTGAGQAGFYVLVGAYMPAVLFEMGFLTNDKDRRVLNSGKSRRQIAERLARAIDRYRKSDRSLAGPEKAREK
jgi:N-acetylmuramoyl-L-alanine amidase